jgi:hypothetical protein
VTPLICGSGPRLRQRSQTSSGARSTNCISRGRRKPRNGTWALRRHPSQYTIRWPYPAASAVPIVGDGLGSAPPVSRLCQASMIASAWAAGSIEDGTHVVRPSGRSLAFVNLTEQSHFQNSMESPYARSTES